MTQLTVLMPQRPAVTVVLPVYNGARFLRPCVDSILNQTLRDFELVVVDDGSTDESPDILSEYAKADSRVAVVRSTTNSGITAALNTGCTMARSEFIAVTNQDDVCLPARLERQVRFLKARSRIAVVGAAGELIDEDGRSIRLKRYPVDPALATWQMHFLSTILHPAATLRRQAIEEVGFYPAGYRGGTEDFALAMRLSRSWRICSLPDVLLQYRIHAENHTRLQWEEQEREADRIVSEGVQSRLGTSITASRARQLRGLYTDQYPGSVADIREVADIVMALHEAFVSQTDFSASELGLVHRDAGVRLWLLGMLALPKAPGVALKLLARALAVSPSSLLAFGAKASAAGVRRTVGILRAGTAR